VTRDDVVRRLRPLLDLEIELVLPAHGAPADRAALERCSREQAPYFFSFDRSIELVGAASLVAAFHASKLM